MEKIRIGVIGAGNMGKTHARTIKNIPDAYLAGLCDVNVAQVTRVAAELDCEAFTDHKQFIDKNRLDGILIAAPHFFHPELAIYAFNHGVHVLCEKPIAVHVKQTQSMLEAHQRSGLRFGMMYQMRLDPVFRKVHEIVSAGLLGPIRRTNWIITNWFRTQAYFNAGNWRGTWNGEGGGLLMSQCPHQFDLFQWICGMPIKVRGFCHFGQSHQIEVEDEVAAYFDYDNGATGAFFSSTGEAPGIDRLEIVGDQGKIILEDGILTYKHNLVSCAEFIRTATKGLDIPPCETIPVDIGERGDQYVWWRGVIENFVAAIRDPAVPLVCPGDEGVKSTMLSNAILLSSIEEKTVMLPLDADAMAECMSRLIAGSYRHR